jgi:hypothetical protein
MVTDSKIESNRLFTIPYIHEKAIVAIPMNIGNTVESSSDVEYALALVIFPHIEFPKFSNTSVAYRYSDKYKDNPYIMYDGANLQSATELQFHTDILSAEGAFNYDF